MKIILNGAAGRMGKVLADAINEKNHQVVAFVDKAFDTDESKLLYSSLSDFSGDADVIIDFSSHLATKDVTEYASKKNLPLVLASTGQTEEELKIIEDASRKVPLFRSANMSVGIAFLAEVSRVAAALFGDADIEIIEKHHNKKADAPSGTALLIADKIKDVRPGIEYNLGRSGYGARTKNELGIHAVRAGNIVGDHEVIVNTGSQQITLKHEAFDRKVFADGAITAAEFIIDKPAGAYNMSDLVRI
jgi:4-hydroxy-tetrahydrodipicolinate reductase